MTLKVRNLPPFVTNENAHIPMQDGSVEWLVIATPEAFTELGSTNAPSDENLGSFVSDLGKIATFKLEHGRASEEQTIWIMAEDVLEWRSLN